MRAGIDEDADVALLVADGKDRLPSERSSDVIARLLQLTLMADIDPDPLPDVLHFQIEDRGVGVDAPVHLASAAGVDLEQRLKRLRGNRPICGVKSGSSDIEHIIRLFDWASSPPGRPVRRHRQRARDIQRGSLLPALYFHRFARRTSNCARRKLAHSPPSCHRPKEGSRAGNAPETPARHLVPAIRRECYGPPVQTRAYRPEVDRSWRRAAGRPSVSLRIERAQPNFVREVELDRIYEFHEN